MNFCNLKNGRKCFAADTIHRAFTKADAETNFAGRREKQPLGRWPKGKAMTKQNIKFGANIGVVHNTRIVPLAGGRASGGGIIEQTIIPPPPSLRGLLQEENL